MILGQGQDTPFGHGQQLCQISSRLDKCVRSYGPDKMWTDGRQTDGQSDKAIPIYPTNFCLQGYNNYSITYNYM